uniref:Uncharacterized protein n=1 Tax=Arundo donax TaxID=35708 RepID=A0A0A8YQD5_ARUDO
MTRAQMLSLEQFNPEPVNLTQILGCYIFSKQDPKAKMEVITCS